MSKERDPFELEPEDAPKKAPAPQPVEPPPPSKPGSGGGAYELETEHEAPSATPPAPRPAQAGPSAPRPAPYVPRGAREDEDWSEVDERTVAERAGRAAPRATESLENPPGWPAEAASFPLRRPGPGFLALGVASFVVLDLVGTLDALRFPAWVAKLLLFVYVLRGQLHVIGTSAAGRDEPLGWTRALQFDRDDLKQYVRTLIAFVVVLAPGAVALAFDAVAIGILLLVAGSMYAAVIALGAAVQDGRLAWPWHAVPWLTTRPLHCVAGSLGWWALLGAELVVFRLRGEGVLLVGFAALALRGLAVYLLLVSARALGVMGRRWNAA